MTVRMVSFPAPGMERVWVLWPLCDEHRQRAEIELLVRDPMSPRPHVSEQPASTDCHYCSLEETA